MWVSALCSSPASLLLFLFLLEMHTELTPTLHVLFEQHMEPAVYKWGSQVISRPCKWPESPHLKKGNLNTPFLQRLMVASLNQDN